jgi:hypothetical protein
MYKRYSRCLYLILSVVPAARNLRPWSWEAVNPNAQIAKARILKSRCLFSRIEVGAVPPHPEVRAAVRVVPVAPAPTAVHAIKHTAFSSQQKAVSLKI